MINNNTYKPKAGLSVLEVIGVNVSNDQYTQLTGRELPYQLNYEKSQWGTMPVRFLTNGPGGYVDIAFNLSDELTPQSKSGKFEFINDKYQSYWSSQEDGSDAPNYNGIDFEVERRRTYKGETRYINFLTRLFKTYTGPESTNRMTPYEEGQEVGGITLQFSAKSLFDGSFNLNEYLSENPLNVIGFYTIKDTGEKLRQRVSNEVFFSGNTITDKITEQATKVLSKGLYGDDYYNLDIVESIEECMNYSEDPGDLDF